MPLLMLVPMVMPVIVLVSVLMPMPMPVLVLVPRVMTMVMLVPETRLMLMRINVSKMGVHPHRQILLLLRNRRLPILDRTKTITGQRPQLNLLSRIRAFPKHVGRRHLHFIPLVRQLAQTLILPIQPLLPLRLVAG